MPVQISDGQGRGYLAGVCSENRLRVTSVSQSIEAHTNQEEGQAYHLTFSQSPTANDDCILYIQNDDDDDLIVGGGQLALQQHPIELVEHRAQRAGLRKMDGHDAVEQAHLPAGPIVRGQGDNRLVKPVPAQKPG